MSTPSEEIRALMTAVADGRVSVEDATQSVAKWMVACLGDSKKVDIAELVKDAAHEERERCIGDVIRTGDVPVNRLKAICDRIEKRGILEAPVGIEDRRYFELTFVIADKQCWFNPTDHTTKRWAEKYFRSIADVIRPVFEDVQNEPIDVEGKRLEAIAAHAKQALSDAFPTEHFTVTTRVLEVRT